MMNEKEQLEQLKKIVENFEETVKQVTSEALNSPKGGDEKWNQLLEKYQIEPSTQVQKEAFYSNGMPVTKGALPAELRKVYLGLRYITIKNYRDIFQNEELSLDAEKYWDDFTCRLENIVEEEVNNYIGKIKQVIGVSNIFANAFSGMNKFSKGLQESGLNTKKCNSCGSPRLDKDQYGECYFCGTPLFETQKVTAKCKICGAPKFLEDQDKVCRFCNT
jgi:hypothetical protein